MRKDKVQEANIEAAEQRRLTASLVKRLIDSKGQDHEIAKAVESWVAELCRWLGISRKRGPREYTVQGTTLMAEAHLDEQATIQVMTLIRAFATRHGLKFKERPGPTSGAASIEIEIWSST